MGILFGDKLGSALDLGTTRPGPGVSLIAALLAEFVLTAVLHAGHETGTTH